MNVFDRHAPLALIVASLTLAASAVGFGVAVKVLDVSLRKKPTPLRAAFATLPKKAGAWRAVGDDVTFGDAMIEELGTDRYLTRNYRKDDLTYSLHIAYYTGLIDAVPHVPDRCFVAAGWNAEAQPANTPLPLDRSTWTVDPGAVNNATGEPYPTVVFPHPVTRAPVTVRMPIGEPALRVTPFRGQIRNERAYFAAGYFFVANGRMTPSPERIRLLAFDLHDDYAYFCKVQVSASIEGLNDVDAFVANAADLLDELLPEIMRCLPDWAEVESGAAFADEDGSVLARSDR